MNSSRPYLLRAMHEWIVDNELTPHVVVDAFMPGVTVPQAYVKDGKIILNIAPKAIVSLSMTNEWVNFDARFSGISHRIRLPIASITAIYAVENGRGMAFDEEPTGGGDGTPPPPPKKGKVQLKVVK